MKIGRDADGLPCVIEETPSIHNESLEQLQQRIAERLISDAEAKQRLIANGVPFVITDIN